MNRVVARTLAKVSLISCCSLVLACYQYDEVPERPGAGEARKVSGAAADLATGAAVAEGLALTVLGLEPAPTPQIEESQFELEVPGNSAFYLRATAGEEYYPTYSPLLEVAEEDLTGVSAPLVSRAFIEELVAGAAIEAAPGTAIVIARVIDEGGTATAGIAAEMFELNGAQPPRPPLFLDAEMKIDAPATTTSTSGYAVFFDVPEGQVTIAAPVGAGATLTVPLTPAEPGSVSVVDAVYATGEGTRPSTVSFSQQVLPIFASRACTTCHSELVVPTEEDPVVVPADGNLDLATAPSIIYDQVAVQISPRYREARINKLVPADSMLIALPLPDAPGLPDNHPIDVFTGPADPDYQTILVWIEEGALNN